jgi:hypothetical protein
MCEQDDVEICVLPDGTFLRSHPVRAAVETFVRDLERQAQLQPAILLSALYFIDQVRRSPDGFPLDTSNACALITGTILLAVKYHDDRRCSLRAWAAWSGFPRSHLRETESLLLSVLKFDLFHDEMAYARLFAEFHQRRSEVLDALASTPQPSEVGCSDQGAESMRSQSCTVTN